MAKISLSPMFLKDSWSVFKERGIKGLLLGTFATTSQDEARLLEAVEADYKPFLDAGARKGSLNKIDPIHRGRGPVYLVSDTMDSARSAVVFGSNTKLANGPDLWLYLSKSDEPRKTFGDYIDLGLLKGNKGGQVYYVDHQLPDLADYKSAVVYCKQFDVLFSYALLK